MNNEYSADKHDYFKYDLWLEIAENVKGIRKLTFIPMLTPKREPKAAYPLGKRRERLYRFLQSCLAPQRRSITRLREFLSDEPFEYHPYRDEDDKGFQNGSWHAYFDAIPRAWLQDAVALIDPDTGLGSNEEKSDKHVNYSNICSTVSRCSGNWVILIVQFTLRGDAHRRRPRLDNQHKRLQSGLRCVRSDVGSILWVAEKTRNGLPGDLAMLAVGASGQTSRSLEALLRTYKKHHGLLLGPS